MRGRTAPGRQRLVFNLVKTLLTFSVFLNLVLVSACGWFAARRLGEAERRQIAGRLREAIERAGGTQVWVKVPPYAPFPPAQADAATEVVAVSASFDTVLAALGRQAAAEKLQIRVKVTRGRERWRLGEIRLTRGRQPAGRWLVREVGQLRRAAIVIDDLGQDLEAARALLALPYPLTFSVLPHLRQSVATAEEAHRSGREVMLHLPMEPDSSVRPGEGEIRVGMPASDIERVIQADLEFVPYASGVNNHMGSRATANRALMAAVMKVLAERGLFFVDSRTTQATVAFDVARRRGLPAFYRSVFLDDSEAVPYTLGQLREFRRVIDEQGAALAIGHPYPTTLTALTRFLPELERHGIQLVPASQLLHLPEVARLRPPRATNSRDQ